MRKTNSLMSENELCSIFYLWWSLGVEDLWLLPVFPASRLLQAGQSIWPGVYHQRYGSIFIGIQGLGPHRNDLTSSPVCAPVGSFLDNPTGVSGPGATSTLQIWPCSPLILA